MPLGELLAYLCSMGDAPDEWLPGGTLVTRFGVRYLRSQEGMVITGGCWTPRYIWCR